MNTHAEKTQTQKAEKVCASGSKSQNESNLVFKFVDNRHDSQIHFNLQKMIHNSDQSRQLKAFQETINQSKSGDSTKQILPLSGIKSAENQVIQKKINNTGLPDNLKSGIENLSGYSMDDVKVHYNSDKPATLQAHAYAQGADIHLGSGQEKHLPHEAWHVVQQKQGRVKPTLQMKGGVNINDDAGLEKDADVMGLKSMQFKDKQRGTFIQRKLQGEEDKVNNSNFAI